LLLADFLEKTFGDRMNLKEIYKQALNYSQYREKIDELLAIGKTTGLEQTDALIQFTKLNISRMNRIDKTVTLNQNQSTSLSSLTSKFKLLLVSDAWCGDCAQITPLINTIASKSNSLLELKIVSRDDFPELFTISNIHNSVSTPKLILVNHDSYELLNTWGPRPIPAQEILFEWKQNKEVMTHDEFEKKLHLWYANDKGQTSLNEIINLIKKLDENAISKAS